MAAKKRGRQKPPEEPALELEEEELEPEPELEDDVLGELDDQTRYAVAVFRKITTGPRTGRPEYVGRLAAIDFSLEVLRERFGGGTMEIRLLRRDDRTNREKIVRTRTVYIAGPERVIPLEPLPSPGPVAVVPPPQSEELRKLAEDNRRLRKLVRRALLEDKHPKRDPLEYFEKAAATLGAIVKPTRGNGVEELAAMFGLFMKMLDRTNRAPAESGLERFLDNVTPAVVGALQEGKPANGAASASSQTAPGAPAVQVNGAANGAGPAVHKLAPVWLQRAQPHFGSLYAFAKNGQDPAQVVALLLQYLDAETRDAIGEAAESEKFVEQTLTALPPAFRGADVVLWVTRFLQLLQEELAPAELEEGQET